MWLVIKGRHAFDKMNECSKMFMWAGLPDGATVDHICVCGEGMSAPSAVSNTICLGWASFGEGNKKHSPSSQPWETMACGGDMWQTAEWLTGCWLPTVFVDSKSVLLTNSWGVCVSACLIHPFAHENEWKWGTCNMNQFVEGNWECV